MPTIIKDERKEYPNPSEGQHVAVAVDLVGPWRAVDTYDPEKPYLIQKVAFVFQLDEMRQDLKPFELSREFTLSFGPRANLRKFISGWRGKEITDAEAKAGVDIEQFLGTCGIVTVEHKPKKKGGIWATITNITPILKSMTGIAKSDYTRAEWLTKRMAEDEAAADVFEKARLVEVAQQEERFQDVPAALSKPEPDDPPF